MLLGNVTLVENGEIANIATDGELITKVCPSSPASSGQLSLHFENAIAFPGLINSHDHLDFNLYPQLGDRFYSNYTQWGDYIHQNYKPEIQKVLKIPTELREHWGMIKNLLGGVTTVVNHGEPVKSKQRLINVFEDYQFIHSVGFEKDWKLKLNNPLKRKLPVAIHVGEGKDTIAHTEISRLLKSNFLRKKLVGIHGVGMDESQARAFEALVWCPYSNYFLLDRTADVKALKMQTNILFGTDSTLTGSWNIWDHIKMARETSLLNDEELYRSLTVNAANIWKLNNKGLTAGQNADIVIAKKKGTKASDAFFALEPQDILLVVVKGNIVFFDEAIYPQLKGTDISRFEPINLDGTTKYIKDGVTELVNQIKFYYPEASIPFSTDQIAEHA